MYETYIAAEKSNKSQYVYQNIVHDYEEQLIKNRVKIVHII